MRFMHCINSFTHIRSLVVTFHPTSPVGHVLVFTYCCQCSFRWRSSVARSRDAPSGRLLANALEVYERRISTALGILLPAAVEILKSFPPELPFP